MHGFSPGHAQFLAHEANAHGRVLTPEERKERGAPAYTPYQGVFDSLVGAARNWFTRDLPRDGEDPSPKRRGE